MTARVHVERSRWHDALDVYIGVRLPDGLRAARPVDLVMEPVEEAVAISEPTVRLPEDIARALCDQLVAYFGGSTEVQTLRKDYVAERGRVDKLTDALVVIATGGQR